MRAASLYGLVTQAGKGRFALTPMGARLRTDIPGSMRSLAIGFLAPPLWQAWGQLAEVAQTGRPSNPASWGYFQQHPGEAASLAELRSLMASGGYEFARDVPLGDSPAWQPWHVVEFVRQ